MLIIIARGFLGVYMATRTPSPVLLAAALKTPLLKDDACRLKRLCSPQVTRI